MNKIMKIHFKKLPVAVAVVLLLVVAGVLLTYERDYLWKVQELNLFLNTSLFFKQQMIVPGGMLMYLGQFFTQFFYHPWLGVSMLCGWWVLLAWLLAKAFRLPAHWLVLTVVPIALLLLANVTMDYWVYYLKLRGWFFIPTLGVVLAVALTWAFRSLPSKFFLRQVLVVLTPALFYPLAGFYALLAVALMAVLTWRLDDMGKGMKAATTLLALLSAVAFPLLYYRFVFYQTNIDDIYVAVLPVFAIAESYPNYYIPYYLLVAVLLLMAVCYRSGQQPEPKKPALQLMLQMGVLLVVSVATWHFWYKDYNFHKELRMSHYMEELDWNGIVREAAQLDDEPTRAIVMMKNLALFRLGRQGDEMYHYRTGAKPSATPIPVNMAQVVGRAIYFHYGQLNYCYRWCLEDGVEHGWCTEYYKYLTRCAMMNGEEQVALKYINILRSSLYGRAWADRQASFIGHRDAMKKDPEYGPVFPVMGYDDLLTSDNGLVEYFLMRHFAYGDSNDPVLQELTLLGSLWMKDIQLFWPHFFHYAELHKGQHIPRHYQEAALLYGNLEHTVDISRMPFDREVVQDYQEFMALAKRCAGMSEEQMKPIFYPRFGGTFYYEYFLIRNQKLY